MLTVALSISFNFTGRTAMVIGAARSIGREFARTFHKAGFNLVAADIDAERVEKTWPAAPPAFRSVTGDVRG